MSLIWQADFYRSPLQNVEGQLLVWMVAMIRPGAAFVAAPMFGAQAVPVQLRLVLALAIGIPSASMNSVSGLHVVPGLIHGGAPRG